MTNRLVVWALAMFTLSLAVMSLADGWRDAWLWTYLGLWTALGGFAMVSIDDDLARERFRPPSAGADAVALRIIRLLAVAHLIVGALDAGRWHLAPVPPAIRAAAMAGMAISFGLFFRAMRANPFFSAVVRIQEDRGHRVVDRGPYARVRHPGYAGLIPAMAFSGLALGSWLAFAMGVVFSALVIRRVLLEDAFLRDHLAGYSEYAQRVRYRLFPGIW